MVRTAQHAGLIQQKFRHQINGPAIVGNFGGGRFFDYTAYGDTINIAARLEAANKQLGTRICVSAILSSKGEGLPRSAGGGPIAEGKVRGPACLRAFTSERVRKSLDKELSRGGGLNGSTQHLSKTEKIESAG